MDIFYEYTGNDDDKKDEVYKKKDYSNLMKYYRNKVESKRSG